MDSIYKTNKIIFDYFSFTIKNCTPEDIIELLGVEKLEFLDLFGSHGYKHRYYYDGISTHFGGREEVWCEMSGQGCRVFESFGHGDFFKVGYDVVTNDNAHFTRVDIAYDDFNGLLDLDKIRNDIKNDNWVSRARKIIETTEHVHGGVDGSSVTIGNTRQSDICCRIYDKAAERGRKDEINHWVRCELQLRHQHADNFISYLLADNLKDILGCEVPGCKRLDFMYFSVLNNFFRLIDTTGGDSNRWRNPICEHWAEFIGSYSGNPVSLYSAPGVEYNVMKLQDIVENMYGGMLYTYFQFYEHDELDNAIYPKSFNLNVKYQNLIDERNKYIESQYFDLLA